MARAMSSRTRPKTNYLALPPASGELPDLGGLVISAPASPQRKPIEHAGHAYQQRLREAYCTDAAKSSAANAAAAECEKEKPTVRGSSASGSELQRKLATDGDDLYALLELGDKRWHATADEIKKAFRRMSLLYHPDKLRHKVSHMGEEAIAETESHFKKVMKAYDILSDKKKRAAYDSIDDVDDTIPEEKEVNDKNFYEVMGECFALNSRWAVSDRVPSLGSETTSMDEVHQFYNFWYSFKTWRDFSFDLEYDTDQAECREEKRWMERQNSKKVKARKLEESARIRKLTDLAYKKDPRIRTEKESAKKKKEALKEARRKAREEEELKKREEEEKLRLEEERRLKNEKEKKANAKREKDAARKLMRKARQKLRGVARDLDLSDLTAITAIEKMCSEGDVSTIEAFADKLLRISEGRNNSDDAEDVPGVAIANITEIVEEALKNGVAPETSTSQPRENGTTENSVPTASSASESKSKPANGTVPNGTSGVHMNGARSKSPSKIASPWTPEEMSLLSKGLGKFPGGTLNRWERLSQYIGTRSEQEVLAQVNSMRPSNLQKGKHKRTSGAKASAKQDSKTKATASESRASNSSGSAAIKSKVPNKMGFSATQQSELEKAMKKYASEPASSKWSMVAKEVTGRSAKECEDRAVELISYYRARKAS